MWVYKIRYWCGDGCGLQDSEGLVAGESIADCYKRLGEYYGENNIEELTIHALDSDEGILDFELNECGLKYENFVQKKS